MRSCSPGLRGRSFQRRDGLMKIDRDNSAYREVHTVGNYISVVVARERDAIALSYFARRERSIGTPAAFIRSRLRRAKRVPREDARRGRVSIERSLGRLELLLRVVARFAAG